MAKFIYIFSYIHCSYGLSPIKVKKVHYKKKKVFKVHYYNMSSGSISIDITITLKQKIEIQPK